MKSTFLSTLAMVGLSTLSVAAPTPVLSVTGSLGLGYLSSVVDGLLSQVLPITASISRSPVPFTPSVLG